MNILGLWRGVLRWTLFLRGTLWLFSVHSLLIGWGVCRGQGDVAPTAHILLSRLDFRSQSPRVPCSEGPAVAPSLCGHLPWDHPSKVDCATVSTHGVGLTGDSCFVECRQSPRHLAVSVRAKVGRTRKRLGDLGLVLLQPQYLGTKLWVYVF